MPDNTALSTRMKENYENRSKQYLTRRTPTIIRLDGKAFHTYTKGLSGKLLKHHFLAKIEIQF